MEKSCRVVPVWVLLAFTVLAVFFCADNAGAKGRGIGWYGSTLCGDTVLYDCLAIKGEEREVEITTRRGTKTVKKVFVDDWDERWPDLRERDIVMKLNRMNYRLREGYVVAAPKDMANKTFMDFSPFPQKIDPPDAKQLIFDPDLLAFAAYNENGELIRWGPAAGGKDYCPDTGHGCRTPAGTFKIFTKAGANYRSGKYPVGCEEKGNCARMPYAMFFKPGYAFHAGYLPGKHASHGCVRLFHDDAMWLNKNFVEVGVTVIVRPYNRESN